MPPLSCSCWSVLWKPYMFQQRHKRDSSDRSEEPHQYSAAFQTDCDTAEFIWSRPPPDWEEMVGVGCRSTGNAYARFGTYISKCRPEHDVPSARSQRELVDGRGHDRMIPSSRHGRTTDGQRKVYAIARNTPKDCVKLCSSSGHLLTASASAQLRAAR